VREARDERLQHYVATVTGRLAIANSVLLKSIFGMGVPLAARTVPVEYRRNSHRYTIRASKDGYVARKRDAEVLVGSECGQGPRDVWLAARRRGLFMRRSSTSAVSRRCGLLSCPWTRLRPRFAPSLHCASWSGTWFNVGAVAQLLRIDLGVVEKGLRTQFARR